MIVPGTRLPAGTGRWYQADSIRRSRGTRRLQQPLRFSGTATVAMIAALTAVCACHSDLSGPEQQQLRTAAPIECVVEVAERNLSCTPAPGASLSRGAESQGAQPSLIPLSGPSRSILGDQDRYVRLLGTRVEYSPVAGKLVVAVALQNLTAQPLGTLDGALATPTGIRAFVTDGPAVVEGSGAVGLANADGTATLSRPSQPYFTYAQVLQGNAVSEVRGWAFDVPSTVQSFRFQVLVQAAVPDESKAPAPVLAGVSASAIATGGDRACAIRTGIGVYCWGRNVATDTTPGTTRIPQREVVLAGVSALGFGSEGGAHMCALTADGAVYCWGGNRYGEFGDGTTGVPSRAGPTPLIRATPLPAEAPAGVKFSEVAIGSSQTCALALDGAARCWGLRFGLVPTVLPVPAGVRFRHLGVGSQSCGLTDGGAVYCWNDLSASGPTLVASSTPFTDLTIGGSHACALSAEGAAFCWGTNANGQLGDASLVSRSAPVSVAAPAGVRFTKIAAGLGHTCAITDTGSAYCWGFNYYGTIGDGTRGTDRPVPTRVAGIDGQTLTQISAGFTRTCALSSSAVVLCWGSDVYPTGGTPEMMDQYLTPTAVAMPAGVVAANVSVVLSNVCVRGSIMLVYCWGHNDTRQLGVDDPITTAGVAALRPLQVSSSTDVTSLFAGVWKTCFANSGGALSCWSPDSTTPRPVTQTIKVAQVAIGDGHACELAQTGAVWCWGRNNAGQLGSSDLSLVVTTPRPVTLPAGAQFTLIAAGGDYNCGLGSSGIPLCWGRNDGGQLGNGTKVYSQVQPTPVTLSAGVTFTSIAAGLYQACGLTPGGLAYCWGRNYYGQLGNGTFTDALGATPVTMPAQTTFAQIVAAGDHTCALTASGEAWCWGSNAIGELGIGSRDPSTTPAAVATSARFVQLTLGFSSTCGRTSGGAIYCWGWHGYGQLGDGTTTDRFVPTLVLSP